MIKYLIPKAPAIYCEITTYSVQYKHNSKFKIVLRYAYLIIKNKLFIILESSNAI